MTLWHALWVQRSFFFELRRHCGNCLPGVVLRRAGPQNSTRVDPLMTITTRAVGFVSILTTSCSVNTGFPLTLAVPADANRGDPVPDSEPYKLYKRTTTMRGLHLSLAFCFLQARINMALLHILRITLVSALLFTSVGARGCHTPRVRKEWRSISSDERAAWIDAVKVFFFCLPQCCRPLLKYNYSALPMCPTTPPLLLP